MKFKLGSSPIVQKIDKNTQRASLLLYRNYERQDRRTDKVIFRDRFASLNKWTGNGRNQDIKRLQTLADLQKGTLIKVYFELKQQVVGWTNEQTYMDGVRKEIGNRIDPLLRTSVLIELNCNFSSLFSPSHPAYSSFEGLCNEKLLLDGLIYINSCTF